LRSEAHIPGEKKYQITKGERRIETIASWKGKKKGLGLRCLTVSV